MTSAGVPWLCGVLAVTACEAKREPPPPAKPVVDALASAIAAHQTDHMLELTQIHTLWAADCKHQSVYERENLADFLTIIAQTVKSPLTSATETHPPHEVAAGDTELAGCPLQATAWATTWRLDFGATHVDVTLVLDAGQWRVLAATQPLK